MGVAEAMMRQAIINQRKKDKKEDEVILKNKLSGGYTLKLIKDSDGDFRIEFIDMILSLNCKTEEEARAVYESYRSLDD